jgi:16S rRNA (cytidine1402-2'-O)-methyltransferase
VGKIILLNTPIGNLGDITLRVKEALEQGTLFAVEDTRVFKELLNHLGISLTNKRVLSLHDHSEKAQIEKLLDMVSGSDLYVASEAGSPVVSDPGYPLIVRAYERGFEVDSYSGVSSPIMALELSGLPPIPFQFHGFLPREHSKKMNYFQQAGVGTHICFEAPTRIEETLHQLAIALPEVEVALVRELSKKFQQVLRFKASDWPEVKSQVMIKGEFILLFHRPKGQAQLNKEMVELANEILIKGATPKLLAKLLASILERPTKDIYAEISQQKG